MNVKLLPVLDEFLSLLYPDSSLRKCKIKEIVADFQNKKIMMYRLDGDSYVILTHEERNLPPYKRYINSPFPYISNLDKFRSSVGEFNEELENFGITTKTKYKDTLSANRECGTYIFLGRYSSKINRCNRYLKRQYTRLDKLRSAAQTSSY
jgi:hypothetical protein